jgi:hypothetical protein
MTYRCPVYSGSVNISDVDVVVLLSVAGFASVLAVVVDAAAVAVAAVDALA